MMLCYEYMKIIYVNCGASEELYEWRPSQLYIYVQLPKESLKRIQACTEFDPWLLSSSFSPFMTWRILELIHWSWYINTYICYSFFKYTFSANYWLRKVFFKFKFYLVIYSFIFFSTDCKDQFSRCRFYKRYCRRSSYIRRRCKKTCQLCKK